MKKKPPPNAVTIAEFWARARECALFDFAAGAAFYLLFCLFPLAFALRLFAGDAAALLLKLLILRFLPESTADVLLHGFEEMPYIRTREGFFLIVCAWSVYRALHSFSRCIKSFYHDPPGKRRMRHFLPGAFLCLIFWVLFCLGFAYYVEHFFSTSVLYGSLGTVMVLLLWFYFSSAALLAGALYNAMLYEKERRIINF